MKSKFLLGLSIIAAITMTGNSAMAAAAKGKINNVAWTFVTGKVTHMHDGNILISLWNESYEDVCREYMGSTFDMRLLFPPVVGKHKVNPRDYTKNVIIFGDRRKMGDPVNNIIANKGELEILSLTETELVGRFTAEAAFAKSAVRGDILVKLCPQ